MRQSPSSRSIQVSGFSALYVRNTLDYESKLDRSPENLLPMIADGEKQAAAFLVARIAAQ